MEFASINQLALPELEPVPQLAPYLNGLNVADAVESFNRLADLLLSDEASSNPSTPSECCKSPGSQWLSSSCASSPAPSDQAYSYYSWSSQDSSCFSTASSSGPASVSSSCDEPLHHEHHQVGRSSNRKSRNNNSNKSSGRRSKGCGGVGDRRLKNATAAGKYRRKLKGREFTLAEQMEREQERNARLRRDIESKISLYREFVALLARNTSQNDLDLANLGFKSLSTILSEVCSSNLLDEETRYELQDQLNTFRRIISYQSKLMSGGQQQSTAATTTTRVAAAENRLVYNFYTDSYIDTSK